MNEDRIVNIELKLTSQEDLVDTLNKMVYEQQRENRRDWMRLCAGARTSRRQRPDRSFERAESASTNGRRTIKRIIDDSNIFNSIDLNSMSKPDQEQQLLHAKLNTETSQIAWSELCCVIFAGGLGDRRQQRSRSGRCSGAFFDRR
jgi:sugar diacid utilization regulator